MSKARGNIEAIRLLKKLEAEGRMATPEEQKTLVKYVGWGMMPQVFEPYRADYEERTTFQRLAAELSELLTEQEMDAARRSTQNAHYTSPEVVSAIWSAVERLGLEKRASILEPSVGIGHFFGLQPKALLPAKRTAVELDPLTSRIAQQLYQNATIFNKGFQETTLPRNFYDLAISNVPFGKIPIHDPAFRKHPEVRSRIHNYFFAKALDLVRPGGIVAFITTHGTMDSADSAHRIYMDERADLLGAIRLPSTAFKKNAGTEVVTDIIFLQKRAEGAIPNPNREQWLKTEKAGDVEHNEYFVRHPEMILGTPGMTGTMYRGGEYSVDGEATPEKLAEAVARLPENVVGAWTEDPAEADATAQKTAVDAAEELREGSFKVVDDKLVRRSGDFWQPANLTGATELKIRGMVGIRDAVHAYFRAQLEDAPTAAITSARRTLNSVYDRFVRKFGPLNRSTNKVFEDDPSYPLLISLEDYNPKTKTAKKAAIFEKRTISPYKPPAKVDTAAEALTVSLTEFGRIDWKRMEALTGKKRETLQDELGDLAFQNPEGGWETQDEYLSGNVRAKLKRAEAAAAQDARFKRNVEALRAVQPADLRPDEIKVKLGSPWIPASDVAEFVGEILDIPGYLRDDIKVRHMEESARWTVEVSARFTRSAASTDTWGTSRRPASDLIEDALNLQTAVVYDTDQDGKRFVNIEETTKAQAKQEKLREAFREWIWKDEERTERLARAYNEGWNNLRPRIWDGSHLVFPGMSRLYLRDGDLAPHQKAAVWRALTMAPGGGMLANHAVGAGKTFEVVATVMEGKRLGLLRKAMIVVPNHLVEQWGVEWRRLYPQANVLVAGKKTWDKESRAKTMARIATHEWDAVIVSHESFKRIPLKKETQVRFLNEQKADLERAIREAEEAEGIQPGEKRKPRTIKELERAKDVLEAKIRELMSKAQTDAAVNFEDLGIDLLSADEAHFYKNLYTPTRLTRLNGVPRSKSVRALDMFMKARWSAERGSRLFFLTATPISNTIGESYVFQRFLQPEALREHGLQHFDSWAAAFGEPVSAAELAPDGSGYRMATRFAQFVNIPELASMMGEVMDTKLAADLKIPVPKWANGKPTIVVSPGSPDLRRYIKTLQKRAEAVRGGNVDPRVDNMLKITGDGRKAALDLRLVMPAALPDPNGKVSRVSQQVFDIWQRTKDQKLTQLVFLDLSTPKGQRETVKEDVDPETETPDADIELEDEIQSETAVYDQIRNRLVQMGVPRGEVVFIHEAKTDADKTQMFDKMNSGAVRVMLASSSKGGVGMNVQRLLKAIHHVDVPWRPDQLEQRNGRIRRQGNENAEIEEYRYVTEGSFDAYMWQTQERKAKFVTDFMKATPGIRSIEDVGAIVLDAAEMKAAASENPLVAERVVVEAEIRKLMVLRNAFDTDARTRKWKIESIQRDIQPLQKRIADSELDIEKMDKLPSGDAFTIVLDGKTYTERKAAGEAILAAVHSRAIMEGRIGIADIRIETTEKDVMATFTGPSGQPYSFHVSADPGGTIQSLEYRYDVAPKNTRDFALQTLSSRQRDLTELRKQAEQPFDKQERLDNRLARLAEIQKELDLDQKKKPAGAEETAEEIAERQEQDAFERRLAEAPPPSKRKVTGVARETGPDYAGERTVRVDNRIAEGAESKREQARAEADAAIADLATVPEALPSDAGAPLRGRETGGVRTVGLAITIPEELRKRGRIDLRGQQIGSARDLAVLAQVYRDPRFETFRIVYTKGDRIVAHEGFTSRLPLSVAVMLDVGRDSWTWQERMKRSGADGYWLLHNHPSGEPLPSEDDVKVTKLLAEKVPGFKGHVVIDSGTYGYIGPEIAGATDVFVRVRQFSREKETLLRPSIEHPLLGGVVRDFGALAELGARLKTDPNVVTLIYANSSNLRVRAIQEVPLNLFLNTREMANFLRGQKRTFGTSLAFAVYPKDAPADWTQVTRAPNREAAQRLVRAGGIEDAVAGGEKYGSVGALMAYERPPAEIPGRYAVAEPRSNYRARPIPPGARPPVRNAEPTRVGPTNPAGYTMPEAQALQAEGELEGVEPTRPPMVEKRVESLRMAERQIEQEPLDLERDSPQTWASLDPKIQRYLRTWTEDALRGRITSGNADPAQVQAWAAVVQGKRETLASARADLEQARAVANQDAEGRANAAYIAAGLDYIAAERAYIQGGTETARALAARARVMEAGANVPSAFLRQVFREIEGVTDEQAGELLRILHDDPGALPDALRAAINPSGFDKWLEYWRAGLVSAPGTQFANVAGNIGEQVARLAETSLAAAVDRTLARNGQRTRHGSEASAELAGALSMVGPATQRLGQDVMAILKLAPEKFDIGAGKYERQVGAIGSTIFGMQPKWRGENINVGRAVRAPFRLLEAFDQWFKTVGGAAELGKLAHRKAIEELGGGASAQAIHDRTLEIISEALDPENSDHTELLQKVAQARLERTYQQKPHQWAQTLLSARAEHKWLNMVLPFLRTPANILEMALERSPVGFLTNETRSKVRAFRQASADIEAGRIDQQTYLQAQGEVADALARPILGTALAAVFGSLAAAGGMTGSGPEDPDEKKALRETGWQPYSFVIRTPWGRIFLPFSRFEPFSTLLGSVADMAELRDSRQASDAFAKVVGSVGANVVNKSYLQGLTDASELVGNPQRFAKQYAVNLGGTIVPNVVAASARGIDPYLRDTSGRPGLLGAPEATLKQIVSRIPGASFQLAPKRGFTGEAIERPGNILTRTLLPVQPTMERPGKELEAYLVKIGYPGAGGVPSRDLMVSGQRIRLTDEEYGFLMDARQRAADRLRRVIQSPGFRARPETTQHKQIREIIDGYMDAARERLRVRVARRARRSA